MNIAVFLGSMPGLNPEYTRSVKLTGEWIAKSGNILVYGGSDTGLMGVLAESVHASGGKIIGVSVNIGRIAGVVYEVLDEYIVTDNMQDRKRKMMELADAYIVFPGSVGILDELTDVLVSSKLKLNQKPCFVMNINGFYDSLRDMTDRMISEGFMDNSDVQCLHFVRSADELIKAAELCASSPEDKSPAAV